MSFSNDEDGDGLAALFGGVTPQADPGPRRADVPPAEPEPTGAASPDEPAAAPQYPGLAAAEPTPPAYRPPEYQAPPTSQPPAYEQPAYQPPASPPAGREPSAYEPPVSARQSSTPPGYPPPVSPADEVPAPAAPQAPPTYDMPPPSWGAPPASYEAPPPTYEAPPPTYEAPPPTYDAPPPSYEAPPPSYGAPPPSYDMPPPTYEAPTPSYEPPAYEPPAYGAPSSVPPSYDLPAPAAPPSAFSSPVTPSYDLPAPESAAHPDTAQYPGSPPPSTAFPVPPPPVAYGQTAPPMATPPGYDPPGHDAPRYDAPAYEPLVQPAPSGFEPPAHPAPSADTASGIASPPAYDSFAPPVLAEPPRVEPTGQPHVEHPLVRPEPAVPATVFPAGPLLPSSQAAVETPEDLERSTIAEKLGLVLAVLTGPIGLAVAVVNAVRSGRRRGWLIGVVRASLVLGVLSTIAAGIAGYTYWNIRADQIQHAETAAASAEFCAAAEADPAMVTPPTLGWPAPAASVGESIVLMQAWTDRWTTLSATAPPGLRSGIELLAEKGQTIINAVTEARAVDDAANQAQIAGAEAQAGVASWYTTYCLEP